MATYYLSIFTLLQLILPIVLGIFVFVFVVKTMKKFEKRAEEKLEIERKNILNQQKQLDELTKKVTNIEKILTDIN
ncbi:hypothetical protein [Amphibacillus sediminis]|uniref:hypothetical protein n=1 Tax=Amphibacillus sediminis TaxID=360185 RepID=UPI0008350CA8|nr:hypothetical protein [Amphibacillus sediminis]